jgi:uroporphyrinogen decarboxylase
MVDGGIDAYQCIDVQAGMDLVEVKRRIGEKVCLIGNVALQILEKGATGEVEGEVRRCIDSAALGGGYVLSPSANVSVGTNASNYMYMIEVAKKYGKYPLLSASQF